VNQKEKKKKSKEEDKKDHLTLPDNLGTLFKKAMGRGTYDSRSKKGEEENSHVPLTLGRVGEKERFKNS